MFSFCQAHVKNVVGDSLWPINIKYSNAYRVHLRHPCIIGPIRTNTISVCFAMFYDILVTVRGKGFIQNGRSLGSSAGIWRGNRAVRKYLFEKRFKMISRCYGQIMLNEKVRDHYFTGTAEPGGAAAAVAPHFFPNVMLKQLRFKTLVVQFPREAYKMLYFYLKPPHS